MAWNFKPSIPLYIQVLEGIRSRIFDGTYPPGSKIPSVREIAEEAAVNPNTVQRAFSELESSGLVVTMRTAGREVTSDSTVIADARGAFAQKAAEEFIAEMNRRGLSLDEMIGIFQKIKNGSGKDEDL